MTFATPSCSSVVREACAKPGGYAIAPAAMIAPWPDHQARHRGDRADPAGVGQRERRAGLLFDRELVVARFGDELFVRGVERGEVEVGCAFDDRHDQEARAVLLLRVDREAEVDPGFDALRFAVGAAERCSDRGQFGRRARQREPDEVGERHLLRAAGRLERGVQLGAALLDRADVQRAERRRDRDRERLLHVRREVRDRALEVGDLRFGRHGWIGNRTLRRAQGDIC